MEEWSSEHWDKMDCWMDGGGLPSLPFSVLFELLLPFLSSSLMADEEAEEVVLDQFHVD